MLFSNTGEFVSVWVHKQLTCVCVCVFLINTPSPNCQSIRMLYDNVGSVCVCVCPLGCCLLLRQRETCVYELRSKRDILN